MGNVSFPDRFELLGLLREDAVVQTFRARERATGRAVEAYFFTSPDFPAETPRDAEIDRGEHEGKLYLVTMPVAEPAPLDSAGAWRVKPPAQPAPSAPAESPESSEASGPGGAAPGDFTRMFQLRQAPAPVVAPAPKPAPQPATTSQPGEFTRAFRRPAAPSAAPSGSTPPGELGEFTRMFHQPAAPAAQPVPEPGGAVTGLNVPAPPARASQPRGVLIAIAVLLLSAIVVFLLARRLY